MTMLGLAPERTRERAIEVRLATTGDEIEAAMRLRFEVFNLELGEGLRSSWATGLDADAWDAICDHLIVEDLAAGEIIGAYRLLLGSRLGPKDRFYSETEFDLGRIKALPGEKLELGRSCVARSHRSFAVINLLWSGIAQYVAAHKVRYLFGCGSLHTGRVEEILPIYDCLRRLHYAPEQFRVEPRPECRLRADWETYIDYDPRLILRRLSPVLRGYLKAGAMVCGEPAHDAEFGAADVFVLLETNRLTARYQQHYFEEIR